MAGKINRPLSRSQIRRQKETKAKRLYGSKVPSDKEVKFKEIKDRIDKLTGGQSKNEDYATSVRGAKRANRRATTRAGGQKGVSSSVGADPYGTGARAVYNKPKKTKKIVGLGKSLDDIQNSIQILKQGFQEQATQARMTGVNADTKIQMPKKEGQKGVKEVKTGNRFNLQNRIGDPALRKGLNDNFNALLDAYQNRWYNKAKDFMGNETGKVTESAYGKGKPRAGDVSKKPKAIGESKEDQKVMQS